MNKKPIDLEYAQHLYADLGYSILRVSKELHRDPGNVSRQMHEAGIITKRAVKTKWLCVGCKKTYINYEMVLGLPKCPNCWHTHWDSIIVKRKKKIHRKTQYVSERIRKSAITRTRSVELGLQDHGFTPDDGCKTAKILFGEDTTCLTCKFERCLQEFNVRANSRKVDVGIMDDGGNIVGQTEVEICRIW